MGAVSNQQIYDLLLEISDDLADIEASVDELLLNMRTLNQELEAGRRELAEQRTLLAKRRNSPVAKSAILPFREPHIPPSS